MGIHKLRFVVRDVKNRGLTVGSVKCYRGAQHLMNDLNNLFSGLIPFAMGCATVGEVFLAYCILKMHDKLPLPIIAIAADIFICLLITYLYVLKHLSTVLVKSSDLIQAIRSGM